MRDILKNNKGINMISLGIAIVILVIITTMLVYNAQDSVHINAITNMYTDIATLRDKIADYYIENGEIPAGIKYTNTSQIQALNKAGVLGVNDDENLFYVIDLNAIDNLTLNLGNDYKSVTNATDGAYDELEDLYIINKNSHNIFYVSGIEVQQNNSRKIYYTDSKDIDTVKVNLRYVDGIKIPDGYSYVTGDKETGITIKGEENQEEYIWIVLEQNLSQKPENITVENEEEFLESANLYKGYYKQKDGTNIIYLGIEEKWSKVYDIRGTYVDEDENEVYIPAGFQISQTIGENRVNSGLVIRNAETKDEFVWIKVPKSAIGVNAVSEDDYDNIEKDLQDYAKDYRKDGYEDKWYEGCGLTEQEYTNLKNKMLSSIYTNGGFYIGRYEAGIESPKTSWVETETADDLANINGLPLSQQDKYPYNCVVVNQAEGLTKKLVKDKYKLDENKYNTSLLFGIQWDLVCKFIEETNSKNKSEILVDSANWGNCSDAEFTITRGSHTTTPSEASLWKNDDLPHLKTNSVPELLTTGATKRNMVLNIYDLAGNVCELTLEKNKSGYIYNIRSGMWRDTAGKRPLSKRNDWYNGNRDIGFRVALY